MSLQTSLSYLLKFSWLNGTNSGKELDPPKALFGSMGMAHRAQSSVPLRWEQGRLSTTGNTPVFQESITCCSNTDRTELKVLLFGFVNSATKNLTEL